MNLIDNSHKKRSSITTRLTSIVTGILVIAVLVSGGLDLVEQQRQLNHGLETKATSLVHFMAQVTPLSILSLNFVEMNNDVKKVVLTDEDAVYAIILNEQNIPLVYFFKDTDPLVTDQTRDLLEARKPLSVTEALKKTGRILEVTAPILSGEKRIGWAILGLSLEQMRHALLIQINMIIIFLIVIICLSTLLIRFALRQILHPVETLTAAATQISNGDLNVVLTGTNRTDELGILSGAFKSMIDQLRELILGLEQHVAELKRTSLALQESEERFRAAFENASVGVCLVATDGRLLKVNHAMCQMFGYTQQELEQMDINSLAYQEDVEISPAFIKSAISGEGNQANFDKRYIHKQGHVIWGHVSISLVRGAQGEPLYFISHVQDVTAQKQAEYALYEKTEELDRYFNNALDLLCIADTDGYFRRLNPAWASTLGFSVSELKSQRFLDLVHPEDMGSTLQALSRLGTQEDVLNFVNRYRCKDGTYRWIEWRSFPSGKSIYAVAHDITEGKRAEEEINKLNQELEQRVVDRTAQLEAANKELEAFAYSVSHDLRAPLRHINGFLELLQMKTATLLDAQSQHYMANISDAARRMSMLIDDLLSFSRMGRQEMSRTQVQLDELVEDILREFKPETEGRDIAWRIDPLPSVIGDRAMLRMVLVNLISNALKYTRPRPRAEIEIGWVSDQEKGAIIFVRDNGVGFDMQYADKLFGVFQRLHRTDEFEGTGIGLANVQRIINRHGGRTWAQAQINHGATFYFSLPQFNQE